MNSTTRRLLKRNAMSSSSDLPNLVTSGSPFKVVDLFCGCGGLSTGFSLTKRFQTLAALDNNPAATATFAANAEDSPSVLTTDIQGADTKNQLIKILAKRGVSKVGDLDCLVGGPPCEGFSQNRTSVSNGEGSRVTKFTDDPRNWLFKWFIEIAAELQPKVVLIENVPDLLRHRDGETAQSIVDALKDAGYRAIGTVLNAADFGVPQMRRRAFFLATRLADFRQTGIEASFPSPTHTAFPLGHELLDEDRTWLPGDMGYWPTVWEAIGDLPAPLPAKGSSTEAVEFGPGNHPLSQLRSYYRTGGSSAIYNHIARPLGPNSLRRVKEIDELEVAALNARRRAREHYHYSYSRLRWAEPARTITKFVYHVGSGMFCHPELDRALTIREAARLQTFPDSFRFPNMQIRNVSALVGSAVPPLLAKSIAHEVVRYLDKLALASLTPDQFDGLRILRGDAVVRRLENTAWFGQSDAEEPAGVGRLF